MEHINIKLDPSEVENINEVIRSTIREEAKVIVMETIKQQEENTLFYTTEETAKKLGCSIPTLRTWRKIGKIKAQRIGASYMFSAKSIADAHRSPLKWKRQSLSRIVY